MFGKMYRENKLKFSKMQNNDKQEVQIDQECLRQAQVSAEMGDAMSMFKSIANSQLLEGFKIQFSRRYKRVGDDVLHDIIGSAVDELYDRISNGERIRKVEGYLWKVTDRKLATYVTERRSFANQEIEEIEDIKLKVVPIIPDDELEEQERMEKQNRNMAISLAEGLIPKLGSPNVQDVMRYIFGAVRNGAQHITNGQIAEALGLDESNVRVWKKRGFDKLDRLAKAENLIAKSHAFTFMEGGEQDEADNYNSDN